MKAWAEDKNSKGRRQEKEKRGEGGEDEPRAIAEGLLCARCLTDNMGKLRLSFRKRRMLVRSQRLVRARALFPPVLMLLFPKGRARRRGRKKKVIVRVGAGKAPSAGALSFLGASQVCLSHECQPWGRPRHTVGPYKCLLTNVCISND